jgi:MFS transporter, DHA2 family, lincomycin resistance protein
MNEIKARIDVKHPYLVMMGLYLGAFIGMFSETSLNVALPQLMEAFQVESSLAQWLVTGYMLVIGLVLPFASLLMKWFPIRKLSSFALGAFLIGALISGVAPTFSILLIGRLIQGIGTGLVLPMMFSVVLEVFPANKIGHAMGVTSLIIMFAPAIGPTLSGILLAVASWRFLFFLFAIILFVGLLFINKYMVSIYEITKPEIDKVSCLTSCIGFGCIVLGAGLASAYGWLSTIVLFCLIVGFISLFIYAKRQLSMKNPILNLNAFKTKKFTIGTILVTLNFGITLSAMYLFPQYLQNGAGYAVALTGMIMLPGGVVNAIVSLMSGTLYDKVGAKAPARFGFLISIVGAALLLFVSKSSSLFYVIACHILLMIGVPLAMSPSQSYALNSLPKEISTDGSTILNTLQQVFGAISTAIATSLLGIGQAAYTGANIQSAFTNGVHYGFIFTLVLAIIGFILSFNVKNKD